MKEKFDMDILSLDWASRTMGAQLDLKNVGAELIKRFKKEIPVKNIRLFIWDKTKRKLIAANSAVAPAYLKDFSQIMEMSRASSEKSRYLSKGRCLFH